MVKISESLMLYYNCTGDTFQLRFSRQLRSFVPVSTLPLFLHQENRWGADEELFVMCIVMIQLPPMDLIYCHMACSVPCYGL